MTDLETLGGPSSYGYDINNFGQVTGLSETIAGVDHGFLYSNGKMLDLGNLGGNISVGRSINDLGQVVGQSYTKFEPHAFLYSNGRMLDLNNVIDPALHVELFDATGINDEGQILADCGGHACLLSPVPIPDRLR